MDVMGFNFERYADLPVLADWLEDAGEGKLSDSARLLWRERKRPLMGRQLGGVPGNPTGLFVYYWAIDGPDENLATEFSHRIKPPERWQDIFPVDGITPPLRCDFRWNSLEWYTEAAALWALIQAGPVPSV